MFSLSYISNFVYADQCFSIKIQQQEQQQQHATNWMKKYVALFENAKRKNKQKIQLKFKSNSNICVYVCVL